MNIVPASIADVPELNALINSAYRGDSSRKGWTTEADLLGGIRTDKETLMEYVREENSVILTCKTDQEHIEGCVYLKQQTNYLYLGMLTVSPEQQGKGVGKLLLQAAEEWAAKAGCSKIIMTVISIRDELIDWYKRHSYYDTGKSNLFRQMKNLESLRFLWSL